MRFTGYLLPIFAFAMLAAGQLHSAPISITYELSGTILITDIGAPDRFNLDGESFMLTGVITDFTPTFVDSNDPTVIKRVDYEGDGELEIGSLSPSVFQVDFFFFDRAGTFQERDFTGFAARTTTDGSRLDYIFDVFFLNPAANDNPVPPPTYQDPLDIIVSGRLIIPGPTPPGTIFYELRNWNLDVTTVIPIPAAAWLFGSALGLLGLLRRRVG